MVDAKGSANFLRGVPAEEALEKLIPQVSRGYARAIERLGVQVLQYGHFLGFKRMRELLADWHHTDPSRVIVGNGGLEMISFFFKSLPRESTILIEESTYDRVVFDAGRYGHRLVGVKLTPDGVDLDDLKNTINTHKAAAFYGIPFHHNPSGIDYSVENRLAVEALCRENGLLCAWDICYEPLRYDGKVNTPVKVDEWGPVLISSFTKTISPGTKCGYLILPSDQMPMMEKIVTNSRLNPNLPTQAFIADFIESGQYEEYLDFLKTLYKPRMDAINMALKNHFPGTYSSAVCGGFFCTLNLKKIVPELEKTFIDTAAAKGVHVAAGWGAVAANKLEEKRQGGMFLRLTFPANTPDQITYGIETLREVEQGLV